MWGRQSCLQPAFKPASFTLCGTQVIPSWRGLSPAATALRNRDRQGARSSPMRQLGASSRQPRNAMERIPSWRTLQRAAANLNSPCSSLRNRDREGAVKKRDILSRL